MQTIKLGTRGSKLALWQAYFVKETLEAGGLSVEIVIIALGTVMGQPLSQQIIVTSIIALVATVGVYGIVALIV